MLQVVQQNLGEVVGYDQLLHLLLVILNSVDLVDRLDLLGHVQVKVAALPDRQRTFQETCVGLVDRGK